jgi:hypothetical protein
MTTGWPAPASLRRFGPNGLLREHQHHQPDTKQGREEAERGLEWHGHVRSTWGKNGGSVRSRTHVGSRWCYVRALGCGGTVVHAHKLVGAHGGAVQWRRRGEIKMARVREGERGRPGLHSECARDVETLAGHARHAVAGLCARSATTFTERCLKRD